MDKQETITWEKPNGKTLETNAEKATIEYCVSLGFKPLDADPPKKPRGRPKKVAE